MPTHLKVKFKISLIMSMKEPWDYNKIISDHELFNKTVYTPLSEAIKILEERQKDKKLKAKIEELLHQDIPDFLKKIDKYAINIQQVATPNFDTLRFIKLAKEFDLKPVFSQYYEDKFTSNNEYKHSLGQLHICNGSYKNGHDKLEKITIVDFNKYNGKKIKDVFTTWGESLVDFHKKLFEAYEYKDAGIIFYDDSEWLKRNGGQAKNYYNNDLLLYICHGILFENFLLKGGEMDFTKNVFLPSLEKVIELTGVKPLIVPLSPIDIEDGLHGYSYEHKIKSYIKEV